MWVTTSPEGWDVFIHGEIDTFQWTCNFELVGKWGERRVLKRPVDESDRTELSGVVCYRADVIHNFYAISRAIYERAPSDF